MGLKYIILALLLSSCVSHSNSRDIESNISLEPDDWTELVAMISVSGDKDLHNLQMRYKPKSEARGQSSCNDAMRYALLQFDRAETATDLGDAQFLFQEVAKRSDCSEKLRNAAAWFQIISQRSLTLRLSLNEQKEIVGELQRKIEALSSIERRLEKRSR